MSKEYIDSLKKKIKYRCAYSGTKETCILFNKLIINKIDIFNENEIKEILEILNDYSDNEIFLLLTNNKKNNNKYQSLINKIKNEK